MDYSRRKRPCLSKWLLPIIGLSPFQAIALHLGRDQASRGKDDKPYVPSVYVQDFLPWFPTRVPPSLKDMDLSMTGIFGSPYCAGQKMFVASVGDAPQDFCRYTNNQLQFTMQGKRNLDFDQYALERIMLGKWLESPLRCRLPEEDLCKSYADIIVVPSLAFHQMLAKGFTWPVSANLSQGAKLGGGAFSYWDTIRSMYYNPDVGRTPVIVIHSSYAWDWPGHNEILRALMKQPSGFVQRVVIATTGSNLKPLERKLFPKDWNDNGLQLLKRRNAESSGPLLLTVPYPTPLINEVRFTDDSNQYVAQRDRPVAVSLFADRDKDGRGSNWIRDMLIDQVEREAGVQVVGNVRTICSAGHRKPPEERLLGAGMEDYHCGVMAGSNPMWSLTVNSAFCIEPPGDTLCRSHFYIALLSGCIPVIVDGGHSRFKPDDTHWAWRGPDNKISDLLGADVNYSDFAVIFNAEDVKRGRNVVKELIDMPSKEPERFQALRQGVDRVAPLMQYSRRKCSSYPVEDYPFNCRDAFSVFQAIVAEESKHVGGL